MCIAQVSPRDRGSTLPIGCMRDDAWCASLLLRESLASHDFLTIVPWAGGRVSFPLCFLSCLFLLPYFPAHRKSFSARSPQTSIHAPYSAPSQHVHTRSCYEIGVKLVRSRHRIDCVGTSQASRRRSLPLTPIHAPIFGPSKHVLIPSI